MNTKFEEAYRAWDKAVECDLAGDHQTATKLFETAARSGFPPAHLELAIRARTEGNQDEVRSNLRSIEQLAETGDTLALFVAYMAYQNWLGEQDVNEQDRIANDYLKRAAELGEPEAQGTLAENYRAGLNGLCENLPLYEYWVQKAIDSGDQDSIYSFVEYLLDNKRPVPAELRHKLAETAEHMNVAAKLLARVAKTERRRKPA